jgi:hypothetical protein
MRWLFDLRRQRRASREAEADRLIAFAGAAAHAIARRMARHANDFSTMRYWTSVQAIIERKSSGPLLAPHAPQWMIYERPRDGGHDLVCGVGRLLAPCLHALDPSVEAREAGADREPALG